MLQQQLNLTPDQTTQVRALFSAERTRMEALRSNSTLGPDERRSQMLAIHQDSETKMRGILTPDQATKYAALQTRMRERRQEGEPPQPPPPPPPPPPPGI